MPKIITRSLLILILLALFPPLMVARARALHSNKPRVHPIQDMDNQPKFRAQHLTDLFADDRAMRPHPLGTVARGALMVDTHLYFGLVDGAWATDFPREVPMSRATLERGQDRFNIYCAPCHGQSGDGNGMVAIRALALRMQGQAATWVEPKPVYDPVTLERPVGELFSIVTHGINTMPAYGPQIPAEDRWAIIAWVKALQRSQVGDWDELPPDVHTQLEQKRQEAIRRAEEEARQAAEEEARRQTEEQDAAENTGGESGRENEGQH